MTEQNHYLNSILTRQNANNQSAYFTFHSFFEIVSDAYVTQLGRYPDRSGHCHYILLLLQGMSESQLYRVLAESDEAKDKITTLMQQNGNLATSDVDRFVELLATRQLTFKELAETLGLLSCFEELKDKIDEVITLRIDA